MERDSFFEKQKTRHSLELGFRTLNIFVNNFLSLTILTNFIHFYAKIQFGTSIYIRDMSSSSTSSLADDALLLAKKVGLHDQSSYSLVRRGVLRSCRTERGDDEILQKTTMMRVGG